MPNCGVPRTIVNMLGKARLLRVYRRSFCANTGCKTFDYLFWGPPTRAAHETWEQDQSDSIVLPDIEVPPAASLFDDRCTSWGTTLSGLFISPNAISEEQERELVSELDPLLVPKPYQDGHWDGVITQYRETERSLFKFSENNKHCLQAVLQRHIRPHVKILPYVHVLDLNDKGSMQNHVDSIKFSGGLVAGLCLLSPCVMRLTHEKTGAIVDLFLPQRSFYALTGKARYDWGHAIAGGAVTFKDQTIPRERRISLIFRNLTENDIFLKAYEKKRGATLTNMEGGLANASNGPSKIPQAIDSVSGNSTSRTLLLAPGLIKKILVEGQGSPPPFGSKVTVHYEGRVSGGEVFDSSRTRGLEFTFTLGEGLVVAGWDEGVKTMKQGERAILKCMPDWAYGKLGCPPRIPPNATVEFEMELLRFQRPDVQSEKPKGVAERIKNAEQDKNAGNAQVQRQAWRKATQCYNRALGCFAGLVEEKLSSEERILLNEIRLPLYNNLALCCLKLNEITKAIENSQKALSIDQQNVKALMRLGAAYAEIHETTLAYATLTKAALVEPSNADIRAKLEVLKQKKEESKKADKSMYYGMFSRS